MKLTDLINLKKILIILALLILPLSSYAAWDNEKEYYTHSVRTGVDVNFLTSIAGGSGGLYGYSLLNPVIGYDYRPLKILGISADFRYHQKTCNATEDNPFYKADQVDFLAGLRGIWYDKPHFSIYSRAKAGLEISFIRQNVEPTQYRFVWDISPVGVEFGGKKLHGYAEVIDVFLGIGVGLKYNF